MSQDRIFWDLKKVFSLQVFPTRRLYNVSTKTDAEKQLENISASESERERSIEWQE
jgi:hypothetical protein